MILFTVIDNYSARISYELEYLNLIILRNDQMSMLYNLSERNNLNILESINIRRSNKIY